MYREATIVMPIYNGASTLNEVFQSLETQNDKNLVEEVIFIDDLSTDSSALLVQEYQMTSSYKTRLIKRTTPSGLATNYNEGIKQARSKYVILMHQDIVLCDRDSFSKVIAPVQKDENVTATYPTLLHPYDVWKTYDFWQRCLFSRFVNTRIKLLSGKFDCFRRSQLIGNIGLFDSDTYRTAGEDGDIKKRIDQSGTLMVESGVEVIHVHCRDAHFPLSSWVKKESQLAEAQGVLLRKYGFSGIKETALSFFRQALLVGLLAPYLRYVSILLILVYVFTYTKRMYLEADSLKILALPFVNFYLLFVALVFSVRGFITQHQRI